MLITMHQVASALDTMFKRWGRLLGLRSTEVVIVSWLAVRGECSCAEVSLFIGRRRQQVQRALHVLVTRKLVRGARIDARDRVDAWALTRRGVAYAKVLERFEREWARELRSLAVDVDEAQKMLERFVEKLINSPGGDGWSRGVMTPLAVNLDVFGLMEGLPDVNCENDEEPPPRRSAAGSAELDMTVEEMELAWRKIWDPDLR